MDWKHYFGNIKRFQLPSSGLKIKVIVTIAIDIGDS